jgi:hypothetical protein
MACVVCELGDECGPMQRTDCCEKPFHWDRSCARALGIRTAQHDGAARQRRQIAQRDGVTRTTR